ncbi:MAG: hypothetical protein IJ802_04390 [Kiritimatiellae bacterium]|nr:hypothetical protein [Kiritimatiellia bacterium]
MKNMIWLLAVAGLCGCIGGSGKPPQKLWTIQIADKQEHAVAAQRTARVGAVSVAAPFDNVPITVLRADGTVARDPVNQFAASPAALLKAALADAVAEDGRFGNVLPVASNAAADISIEAVFTQVALDCTVASSRFAVVKVDIAAVDTAKPSRKLIATACGESRVDASSGNFSLAFSSAAAKAIRQALAKLQL